MLFYYNNIMIGLLCFTKVKKTRLKKIRKTNKNFVNGRSNLTIMKWTSDVNYQFYLKSGEYNSIGRVYVLQT